MADTLYSYHFDLGNSNNGSLGMCLRVKAHSNEEAVEKANAYLDGLKEQELDTDDDIEYCNVYLSGNLTADDIDDYEEVDESEEEE
jgi:hypothetical protein